MVQVRKLVLAIAAASAAAASALAPGMAQALELGEITLKSTANQPLVAEIELRDVDGLTAPEIVPSLAPAPDFSRAGVDRKVYLNDLRFNPVINPNGRSVIEVSSSVTLPDPLVKFLVQVIYPSGRLMRDYSVLVDPARFSPQTAAAAAARNTARPAVTAPNAAGQYSTGSRDTLWEIAARVRGTASVQQTMLAIQALNPDAFVDGNINRLRTGQVLRMPTPEQSTALAQPQAIAEVARQNAAWREGRRLGPRAQQLDARRGEGRGNAPAPEARDNLSLVSGESRDNQGGAAADQRALTDRLATTQESLDTSRRENEELKSRLGDLQSQLDKLQRLIELKNNQLARLEAEGQPAAPGAAPGATTGAEDGNVGEEPPLSADLVPPAGVQSSATPAPGEGATPLNPDGTLAQGTPTSPGSPSQGAASPDGAAPSNSGNPPPPPPVPGSEEGRQQDPGLSPGSMAAIGGAAVLVLLLGAWLLIRRRNAQQEAEKHMRMAKALAEETEFRDEDFDLPPNSFEGLETPPPNVKLAPAMVAASAAAATAAAAGEPAPAPKPKEPDAPAVAPVPSVASLVVAPAGDSVLVEAEQSIAQGRFNHAADLLEPAVEAEPDRSDLRLKLMEVYAHQGDRDMFIANERRLMANGSNHAQVEALKSRFPAMLGVAAAGLSAAAVAAELDAQYVEDLLKDDDETTEPLGEVFDTDFDLSLDGIDTAPVAEGDTPAEEASADIDFDALLRDAEAERAAEVDLSEFDLDIAADEPSPSPTDDLDTLEPLGADEPQGAPDPTAKEDLSEDFDLSVPEEEPEPQEAVKAQLDELSARMAEGSLADNLKASSTGDDLDEFDFLSDTDEVTTKLDLARAYIEMQDADGARDILDEVLKEGTEAQKREAREMLSGLS